ncbi:MAG TPA: rRNA methyltransferase [Maribacter sp.]|uniref:TrmH family RNA methyltransferase n=1 Tax=unclassified Maribacter TaxID=2615042 RepID=UPI000EC2DB0F|nr:MULTISPECIES: RNA methyltransferase [unclassified Maribacter]HAF76553.1 rRNA methyltransferase [Maribacter sp.]HAI42851.1 rRNA methyltransferase [Maribacter sp.]|tara:strand:- start:206599 stop:207255 length:657 start_codon:yes stop_codon:yes gene_type:complete
MIDMELLNYLEEFISENRKERFTEILSQRTNYITVAVEDVYQMHNTSAVVRSCESFGVQTAHLIEGKYGKRLDEEIAMGAQKWVDIKRYQNSKEAIDTLKNKGYKIVATSPHANSSLLQDFKLNGKTALFFGTEKNGLSDYVLENSDASLKIPMVGFTESLNISVSAAIILQHVTTQLKSSNIDWQLTEDELWERRLDWTKKSIKSIDDILERYKSDN